MNTVSILGVVIGLGAVVLGNIFEGGHTQSLLQGSAFFIVMGGTVGAVLLSHQGRHIWLSLKLLRYVFGYRVLVNLDLERFLNYSKILKKEGRAGLEQKVLSIQDLWERDAIKMVIDGISPVDIRDALETRLHFYERQLNFSAKVFSDAGGYAPTIGILGAVLGLIHVMGNLTDTSKLGSGIAVAFVATIYGVGFSNLIFLPIANKMKFIIGQMVLEKQRLIEGTVALASDAHSLILEVKMNPSSLEACDV
jgi:chemotaxis protein MotA